MTASEGSRIRHREQWQQALKRNLDPHDGLPAVIKKRGPLADWQALRRAPSGRARDELTAALEIAAGDYRHPLVRTCLERCLTVVTAGKNDHRWESSWSTSRQVEYADLLSTALLADAWVNDAVPEHSQLVSAATALIQGAQADRPSWTELAQSEYLHGVQLLLIAGEIETAAVALKAQFDFSRVQVFFRWHVRLADLLLATSIDGAILRDHFDTYFDEIRNPFFRAPVNDTGGNNVVGVGLARLRLALIRWIYIERKPIAGNWRQIIGQIGY